MSPDDHTSLGPVYRPQGDPRLGHAFTDCRLPIWNGWGCVFRPRRGCWTLTSHPRHRHRRAPGAVAEADDSASAGRERTRVQSDTENKLLQMVPATSRLSSALPGGHRRSLSHSLLRGSSSFTGEMSRGPGSTGPRMRLLRRPSLPQIISGAGSPPRCTPTLL